MKLFGIGNVKDIFLYMKERLLKIKDEIRLRDIFIEEAESSGNAVPARIYSKGKNGEPLFKEQVLYLKWPLKPRMFIEMKSCGPNDLELQLKSGRYEGKLSEAPAPPEDMDVLTIPEVIQVPVISPVMQEEKLMNVDIITERGIFIGLGMTDASFYLDKVQPSDEDTGPGYKETKDETFRHTEDPVLNNLTDMAGVTAEIGAPGTFSRAADQAAEAISGIFAPEDIYHEDISDSEIEEPERSDVTSGISKKRERKK